MVQHFHNIGASRISYYTHGKGSHSAICFHGYGEDATSYSQLAQFDRSDLTFYLVELPFHGNTKWDSKKALEPHDLVQFIEEITPTGSPIILVGYSLGGRVVLSLYEMMHARVKKILLIAPDGLKVNPWYWLATQNVMGNRLFKFTMDHPRWFFVFLKGMDKLGMVNRSIFKFVNYYIGDDQVRKDLYDRWTTMRKFRPNLNNIKKLIHLNKTRVDLFYGAHDKIILPTRGKKFQKGIESFCTLTVLDTGHRLLESRHAPEIFRTLNDLG